MTEKKERKGRPKELKQLWMTAEDEKNFEAVAHKLTLMGYDVKHQGNPSLTKVVRTLLLRELVDTPQK